MIGSVAFVAGAGGAEAVLPCDSPCVRPLSIVDRWDDSSGPNPGGYDLGDDYDDLNHNGMRDPEEPYLDHDGDGVYTPPEFYDPALTGYVEGDVGVLLTIKLWPYPSQFSGGFFLPVDFPPLGGEAPPATGEEALEGHLTGCSNTEIAPGDSLRLEPGSLLDTFRNAFQAYLTQDPTAYWDSNTNEVSGSAFPPGQSPRFLRVTFFVPISYDSSGRNWVVVGKEAILFLENAYNDEALVRFVCLEPTSPTPVQPTRWGQLKSQYR